MAEISEIASLQSSNDWSPDNPLKAESSPFEIPASTSASDFRPVNPDRGRRSVTWPGSDQSLGRRLNDFMLTGVLQAAQVGDQVAVGGQGGQTLQDRLGDDP